MCSSVSQTQQMAGRSIDQESLPLWYPQTPLGANKPTNQPHPISLQTNVSVTEYYWFRFQALWPSCAMRVVPIVSTGGACRSHIGVTCKTQKAQTYDYVAAVLSHAVVSTLIWMILLFPLCQGCQDGQLRQMSDPLQPPVCHVRNSLHQLQAGSLSCLVCAFPFSSLFA